jgi:hypothetical protein
MRIAGYLNLGLDRFLPNQFQSIFSVVLQFDVAESELLREPLKKPINKLAITWGKNNYVDFHAHIFPFIY